MIITPTFVVLNNPKTGSTFVRSVLRRLHGVPDGRWKRRWWHRLREPAFQELLLPNIKVKGAGRDQHGTLQQIPRAHQRKQVVSVVRDPLTRLISTYHFGWWRERPPVPKQLLLARYPHFPELSLEEYLGLEDLYVASCLPDQTRPEIGMQTIRFIQMFFPDPDLAFKRLGKEGDSQELVGMIPPIRFLRTEALNRELHDFLESQGYPPKSLGFILEKKAENRSPVGGENPLTSELIERISHRERLLYSMLTALGFDYDSIASRPS